VHHRTIQIKHQPDASVFQFIILTFIYSSTCFGLSPRYEGKTRGCHCRHWAPDDGREKARNMLNS